MWYQRSFRRHLCDMHIDDWSEEFLSRFSPSEYVENLKRANVQNAMIYFQSHVGLCYFPTEVGQMHAAFLGREDLIRQVVDLCHKAGITVTGYYSLIYNNTEFERHPEWRMVDGEGRSLYNTKDIPAPVCAGDGKYVFRYGLCCPNNMEYRAFVKPEMYFFPSQCNNYEGEFGYTFFGLRPETTKEEVKTALENFSKGDNHLLDLSQAYKITLDTGWDVPPGVLHAPASLCTYEPQFASDVYAMYQSVLYGGHCVSEDLLWKNCPEEEKGNFDYLMDVIDWEKNVDPKFSEHRFMKPMVITKDEAHTEEWICYKCKLASAKRLTVNPGQSVVIKDAAAYGFILLQGRGTFGAWELETPTLIRYGELTNDEFFVTESAAREGILVTNTSKTEPLVMLKHFAENPELPEIES